MKLGAPGKVAGAAVGLWVAGPVGALVGLAVGHAVDRRDRSRPSGDAAAALAAVPLFAAVSAAGGPVQPEAVRRIRGFFARRLGPDETSLAPVREALAAAWATPPDPLEAARSAGRGADPAFRRELLQSLHEVALARPDAGDAARPVLEAAAAGLGLEPDEVAALRAAAAARLGWEADHARLGLPPDAGPGRVRAAWRRLAATHHPDRVAHLGPEAIAEATERFAALRAAYDRIRAGRGE